ncbi:MAG: hypothetical protein HYS81_03580 [Candidatus Aenigmatarchaeota archaeon]|nr:MAG: hypothetical protein HYS81_03580 [Candidatus Aenigmarchaeota archaeon]
MPRKSRLDYKAQRLARKYAEPREQSAAECIGMVLRVSELDSHARDLRTQIYKIAESDQELRDYLRTEFDYEVRQEDGQETPQRRAGRRAKSDSDSFRPGVYAFDLIKRSRRALGIPDIVERAEKAGYKIKPNEVAPYLNVLAGHRKILKIVKTPEGPKYAMRGRRAK